MVSWNVVCVKRGYSYSDDVHCSLVPRPCPLTRKRVWWLLSDFLVVPTQQYWFWTNIDYLLAWCKAYFIGLCAYLDDTALLGYTPLVDELAICIPQDRNYAFYTVRQTLVYGNMRKITEMYGDLQQNTETLRISCRTK